MSPNPLEALKKDIVSRRSIIVIGSGVSAALTNNAPTASWAGLIKSGVSRASSFNLTLPVGWEARLLEELHYAQENNYLPGLLSVAEQVTSALGGPQSGTFRGWLREDIGELKVKSSDGMELMDALDRLQLPLATTNYDSLLENALGRSPSTWQDASSAQQIIRGTSKNVLHLHGAWEFPESIIFGAASYGKLLSDSPAQAIEQILVGDNTLIFIGCGDGLSDPNFQELRGWLQRMFESSEANHYRLCLADEVGDLARQHVSERIIPVAYGNTYDALTEFIGTLASSNEVVPIAQTSLATIQERAVEAVYARVRTETVMADHFVDVDTRTLDDILIPPVFLPMTAEQFAQSMRLEKGERPNRCDPRKDVENHECILVVSDMTAGLTSSLEWLVAQANRVDETLTPVVVDFRSLGKGHRPLERQVRKELRQANIFLNANEPLPKMAIAFDNLTSRPEKIFSRALDELKDNATYAFCALGCHGGAEAEILESLISSGRNPAVRYIGKLNRRDAKKIAALIEPSRADKLAAKAMRVARDECLPRTPLIIGLLVCMLLRGETLLSTASPTALLDEWVNLLLGRGDPHDDARFSLDSLEKADILGFLAERYVQTRTGSLSEGEAIACLDDYFAAVGWKEDPIEVLDNFKKRYLLSVSNSQVRFTQSSYLHLFAAKRAIESLEFRSKLYEDMLYFAPIIRHYAALTRNDEDLLGRVEQLLSPSDQTMSSPVGRNFSTVSQAEVPESSIEDLLGQLSLSPSDTTGREGIDKRSGEDGSEVDLDTWLDQMNEGDREPFPVANIDEAPPIVRIMTALTLVSNVLRDSELVKNLSLKERVLNRTLLIWGKFADLLDSDEGFARFWKTLANEVCDLFALPEERRSEFVERFSGGAPVLMSFHGISENLSSRKLLRSLEACFADAEFLGDAAGSVMGALMGYDIHEPGWAGYFIQVQKAHERVMAVSDTMRAMAETAYYHEETMADDDSKMLLEFLVTHHSQRVVYRSSVSRKQQEARIAQKLKQNRILMRARRTGTSAKAIPGRIDDSGEE